MTRVLLAAVLLFSPAGDPPPGPRVLMSEEFKEWKGPYPGGWQPESDGHTPGGVRQRIVPVPGGGLRITGEKGWPEQRLVRTVPLEGATFLRLSGEGRVDGMRREGYAGGGARTWATLSFEKGKLAAIAPFAYERWTREEVLCRVPEGRSEVTVSVSSAITGLLEVRDLRLEALGPADAFDALVRHMDRYYSHRGSRGKGWEERAAALRPKALAAADEAARFEVFREFLAPLGDAHVTLRTSAGRVLPTTTLDAPPNSDFRAVAKALKEPRQIGKLALAGIAGNDCGYLAIGSLVADGQTFLPVVDAVKGMKERRGILLDLRGNGGGDERRGMEIATLFARKSIVYARSLFRNGPAPGDFGPPHERHFFGEGDLAGKPLVVLLGPRCVSSGEGMAQMFAAIPGVILAGLPTAGQSGNPQPADLPGGGAVVFSRWVSLMPDGTPIEGRGVLPHREIRHEGPGDPTFVEGLRILEEAIAAAGK